VLNKNIIKEAIYKAVANGWEHDLDENNIAAFLILASRDLPTSAFGLIYNHNFAKALWGDEQHLVEEVYQPDWEYHLQQMVISDDPIAYLSENI
jgi:hypothetical protein